MSRVFLLCFLICSLGTAISAQDYFQQQTNYKINATLDTLEKSLALDLVLTYTNNSPDALSEIYFHLWWNCFSDKTSAFADQRLAMGMMDHYFADEAMLGGYSSISFFQGADALEPTNYLDENNKRHTDIIVVPLQKAVAAGATTQLHIEAVVQIPAFYSRGGWQEDLFRFTQWYPKPAVYDDEGWHPMPYLDAGEFFSEYGSYELTYTVPRNHNIATTGLVQSEEFIGETKVVTVTADNVPDIAWASSSSFVTKERIVDLDGHAVPMTLFTNYQSGYDTLLTYMEDALRFYSEQVGLYPYPQYSLVLTHNADRGGMEYPMLSIIDLDYLGQSMDNLIAHEVGHNWFQSAIGSNERRYPWIDEGFNSFVERKYNDSKYAEPNYNYVMPDFYKSKNAEFSVMQAGVCHLHCCGKLGKIDQESSTVDIMTYGTNSYERMAFALRYLEAYLGVETFRAAMHELFSQWKHRHPGPAEIKQVYEAVGGKNLSWFFNGLIEDEGYYDYKITAVKEEKDNYLVSVTNQTESAIPIHLTAYNAADEIVFNQWVEPSEQNSAVPIPKGDYQRITVNGRTPYLDLNRRDNHFRFGKFPKRAPLNLKFIGQQGDSYQRTISLLPVPSYNVYNGLMLGVGIHNEFFPYNRTRWHVQPAFGLRSRSLAGVFAIEHDFLLLSSTALEKVTVGLSGRRFDTGILENSSEEEFREYYNKLRPRIALHFDKGLLASSSLEYKLHYIFQRTPFLTDAEENSTTSLIHQLEFRSRKKKKLRAIETLVQLEYESYADVFEERNHYLKLSLDRSSSLHYNVDSRLFFRFFGGYFLSNSRRNASSFTGLFTRGSFAVTQQGFTDHSYEGYYFNRFDQSGSFTNQIMIEEGGFKIPLGSSFRTGLSNDFLLAANLKADLPFAILKYLRPRPFADFAYYSTKSTLNDPLEGQFLYATGIAIEVGKILGVYFPVFFSEEFDLGLQERNVLQRISFQINIPLFSPWLVAEQPGILLN